MQAGEAGPVEETPAPAETTETTSVFIPKEALKGRECKPGEKLTFTVKDVDADTGEVEAMVEGYDEPAEDESTTSEAIDDMED